jgi:anti-anti-sigma factor
VRLFDLKTTQESFGLRAALSGEIDMSVVDQLKRELDEAINGEFAAETLALDLRQVNFLDSSGLRLVLQLNERLRDDGRRLVVVMGPRRVAKVFELTGADETLETVVDPAEIS